MKYIVLIIISLLANGALYSQTVNTPIKRLSSASHSLAEEGTYQILVTALEFENKILISPAGLREVEINRNNTTDVVAEIDGMVITIMSQEKINNGLKWPKYKISIK